MNDIEKTKHSLLRQRNNKLNAGEKKKDTPQQTGRRRLDRKSHGATAPQALPGGVLLTTGGATGGEPGGMQGGGGSPRRKQTSVNVQLVARKLCTGLFSRRKRVGLEKPRRDLSARADCFHAASQELSRLSVLSKRGSAINFTKMQLRGKGEQRLNGAKCCDISEAFPPQSRASCAVCGASIKRNLLCGMQTTVESTPSHLRVTSLFSCFEAL